MRSLGSGQGAKRLHRSFFISRGFGRSSPRLRILRGRTRPPNHRQAADAPEARRIAANIAKLPELLGGEPKPDANALVHRR